MISVMYYTTRLFHELEMVGFFVPEQSTVLHHSKSASIDVGVSAYEKLG
jgi:hypothetical protein